MEWCLICENYFKKDKIIKVRDGYYYLVCPNCSGGILGPRQKALKALKKAYQSAYFDWREAVGFRKYLNKFQLFTSYSEWIENIYQKKGKKLLDIGTGIPDFVLEMQKKGWDPFGLEISKEQV